MEAAHLRKWHDRYDPSSFLIPMKPATQSDSPNAKPGRSSRSRGSTHGSSTKWLSSSSHDRSVHKHVHVLGAEQFPCPTSAPLNMRKEFSMHGSSSKACTRAGSTVFRSVSMSNVAVALQTAADTIAWSVVALKVSTGMTYVFDNHTLSIPPYKCKSPGLCSCLRWRTCSTLPRPRRRPSEQVAP